MEEIAPVWYVLTGDHTRLDDKEVEVLNKNLVPLSNEVGFCLNTKEEGSACRSWQFFRWNNEVTRRRTLIVVRSSVPITKTN